MKAIYKYPFDIQGEINIEMPKDAQILSIQVQHEIPCIWALVNTKVKKEMRKFVLHGTGHPVEILHEMKHVGTFQLGGGNFIGHLFEYKNKD